MTILDEHIDPVRVYRETSALKTIRMDGTGDTGGLLEIIRDTVVVIGQPADWSDEAKIPDRPGGSIDAYFRG